MPVPNLTRADAQTRAALLEVTSYDVELDLTDGGGKPGDLTFRSRTTVRFGCRKPAASSFIDVIADGFREVTLNGEPVDVTDYAHERGIALTNLAADNTLVVDANCIYTNTGEGLHRFVDPVDGAVYLYSQFETADAKRMYACFDQPDLKATFTLRVIAPDDWKVVSNGKVERTEPVGPATLTHFATTARLSPYITALVAGPYHEATDSHDGIDLGIYCRASLAQHLDADEIFAVTRQGFDFYHQAFGYRYPFGKYDQCFVPEFNAGAMENAGCVTFLEDYVFRSKVTDASYERRAETILHEMAHMWFGDLVTMRWWDDLWLNESFATFASVLCQAEATRWRESWTTFANVEKTWAYRQDQLPSTHPIAADIVDVQAVEVNFDGITYAKGASVLKQLAAYVGIEAFLDAMKSYFRDHEYGNTTLSDLLGALEKSSGRDLSHWSAQWLETAGINGMRADFEVGADGRFSSFAVLQDAPGAHNVLREHRLAIGLYAGTPLRRVQRLELDVSGERTEVPELVGAQQPDLVLVNDDDLTYAKLRLDERSLATVTERVGELPDSLPRALVWSAAWDMTRDAEMATRDFLSLVLHGIDAETSIGVVQSLHRQVETALGSYADPAWAATGWTLLADKAVGALQAAEPGSDHQLAWARVFASAARSADHLALLRGLLDGTTTVPGLVIDDERRWSLLNGLVSQGAAGDAEIDAEEERDATAAGQRHAATARALKPTAEGKAEAWRRATEDDSLPNAVNTAIIRGFSHPSQAEVLRPYTERYFAVIDEVWARRSSEIAQNVVIGLFPHAIVEQSTVDAADAWLADTAKPPALHRLVLEGRDTVARCLRAQVRDAAAS
ncbi:MAG TPA: aminopeptidase N [Mycobacteriales bacterium]|nr:aminopeptidase N [Mycobacteriales bacterium]